MELPAKLRPATNADRGAVEALVFSVLRSYGLEPSPDSTDADLADIEAFYFANGGFFDVLENEAGDIVGTVAVHRTTADLCELRKMYLHPSARGQGLGKRLVEHALGKAKELGYRRMWLETANRLKEAHGLYRSYGFEPFTGPHCSDRCDFALARDL